MQPRPHMTEVRTVLELSLPIGTVPMDQLQLVEPGLQSSVEESRLMATICYHQKASWLALESSAPGAFPSGSASLVWPCCKWPAPGFRSRTHG